VGTFTDRMHAILQSAEEEAAEIRNKARAAVRADEEHAASLRAAVRAEEDAARRTLADLVRRRDAVLAELTRVRGQLEGLLSGPTARITVPTQESGPERREVGAGQPLPGTPDLFEPATESEAAAAEAPAGLAATATGAFPAASTDAPDEPDAADRPAPPVPAEQTLLMDPVTDEPAAEAEHVESTQAVAPPVGRPAAHDQDADDSSAGSVETPTQVAPASPARSG
jgi:syndecan 1